MIHRYRYRVLGATQVLRPDGTEVPLAGARLRALLAALAAGGGRAVPTGQLAAQVWGEDEAPPADETAALQALVGRLRRALGKETVVSAPGTAGYRLAAERDEIDLFRFERLAAEGSAALDEGEAEKAAAVLDEALALWRGPVLADLPGRDGEPLTVRAERRYAEARRFRLAAEVAAGRAEGALAELAALTAGHPLDEPLQALRIRALRAAGRQAEALQAYEEVRVRLADRLGADPGPELRALHAELLSPAPALSGPGGFAAGPPPGPASPERPGGDGAHPPGNLRARLTSFVGRETELAELTEQLRGQPLVTLTGPGGAGKTRLSLEAAEAAAEAAAGGAWPDGVWLAELAPVRDPGTVPEAVLTALGARTTGVRSAAQELSAAEPAAARAARARDPLAQLVEHCGQRRMLVVLDNCEHVIGAAAELAETVLTSCPGVTVLATSREPLGVPGESVRPVGPLPQETALRLLADRGRAARPGFRTDEDPSACAEICRRLDGLPLAVELAAARLRALTPRQIADRLDDRFRLLSSGSRTVLPRQQTLRAVVDWSWDLLEEGERAVLRRLAVFSGGCRLDEAEAVCADAGLPGDVVEPLSSLVDKSLVVAAPDGRGGMRYRLLETVAEYAGERLAASGEREAVERRHLTAYRELARTGEGELRGPRQVEWLERFEAEHDNLRTALRTAVDLREEQDALCLVLSMSWFWQLLGHHVDAGIWSAAVATLAPDPFDEPVQAAVPLRDRCTDAPPPWSDEQLWEARRGVRLMIRAGSTEDDAADLAKPEAQAYLGRIVTAYRQGQPQTCRQPGSVWYFARLMTGEFASLEETLDAVVRDCRELGPDHGWELGFTLLMRAKLRHRPDALDRAARDADQALELFERAGDPWGIAESLSARGEAYERRGRYEEAAADFERAMEGSARIGARLQVPVFKARLADVRLRTAVGTGARERAERLLLEAVAESRRFGGETISTAGLLLIQHYGRTGRTGRAREQLDETERAFPPGTPAFFGGVAAGLRGWLDCLDGEYGQAEGHIREAVRRFESLAYLVAPRLVTDQFLGAAWAKAHLGGAEDGARLLGAYDRNALTGGFGLRPFPDEAEIRRRAEGAVRGVLEAAAYERAYAEGGGLTVKEAAALV
ncbi:AfsR/SARP family transcriptional regulator [Streptomyces sp. 7N604]|uniref:AfsR/SARP family transcriptional regulator n=1 Tax=Streptomyces sp. 7N604 TaxID=3457415 RepID=UPI003FD0C957